MRAGLAKVDITVFEPGMTMLGWGRVEQRVRGVHTPLSARALVLEADGGRLFMLTAELAFVSGALRASVLRELAEWGVQDHELLLSATHTHSGPSGFSHHLVYNACAFGYSPDVFHALVDRFVDAFRRARARLVPAELRVGQATLPLSEPVAFNRSLPAYLQNPDATPTRDPAEATDRNMTCLRVDARDGRPLGMVGWFGVHGTSVHGDSALIHPDNKGVAAAALEASRPEGFVALLPQEASGDVSPNYRWDARRGVMTGACDDDFESAEHNGRIQSRYFDRAWRRAGRAPPLAPVLETRLSYHRLGGEQPVVMGMPMAAGTAEGRGPLRPLALALSAISRLRHRLGAEDPRLPWISLDRGAEGRFLGLIPMRLGFRLVSGMEPMIAFVHAADDAGEVGELPWVPTVLPVQIWQLGDFACAALPVEPTVVAGRRLRDALAMETGARTALLTTHANDYAGYVCTPEEYVVQRYEAGASLFGKHALDRLRDAIRGRLWSEPRPTPLDEARLLAQRAAGRRGLAARGMFDEEGA